MKKITTLIFGLLMLSGCTREVYLQEVPCTNCQKKPTCEATCTDLTPQCCPELAMQRETIVYQVYEVPVQPVYTPCATCHTNCRKVYNQ